MFPPFNPLNIPRFAEVAYFVRNGLAADIPVEDLPKELSIEDEKNERGRLDRKARSKVLEVENLVCHCIYQYTTSSSLLDYVIFRIINAVKSLFNQSEWQITRRAWKNLFFHYNDIQIRGPQKEVKKIINKMMLFLLKHTTAELSVDAIIKKGQLKWELEKFWMPRDLKQLPKIIEPMPAMQDNGQRHKYIHHAFC